MGETATSNDTDDGCDQTHESGLDDDEGKDRPPLGTERNEDRQVARALCDRRRAGVVNDEHPGQESEEAQAVDHRLKGSHHPLEAFASERRSPHTERWREDRTEPIPHGSGIGPRPEDHVNLIDAAVLAEKPLRRRQVHHRQVAPEDRGDSLGAQKAPDVQPANATGSGEGHPIPQPDVPARGVLLG